MEMVLSWDFQNLLICRELVIFPMLSNANARIRLSASPSRIECRCTTSRIRIESSRVARYEEAPSSEVPSTCKAGNPPILRYRLRKLSAGSNASESSFGFCENVLNSGKERVCTGIFMNLPVNKVPSSEERSDAFDPVTIHSIVPSARKDDTTLSHPSTSWASSSRKYPPSGSLSLTKRYILLYSRNRSNSRDSILIRRMRAGFSPLRIRWCSSITSRELFPQRRIPVRILISGFPSALHIKFR